VYATRQKFRNSAKLNMTFYQSINQSEFLEWPNIKCQSAIMSENDFLN